jgi:type II secretion system protein G
VPILSNSQRTVLQATYAPIRRTPDESKTHRAWEKWSFAATLGAQKGELAEVRRRVEAKPLEPPGAEPGTSVRDRLLASLDVLISLPGYGPVEALSGVQVLGEADAAALGEVAEELVSLRSEMTAEILRAQQRLLDAYRSAVPGGTDDTPEQPPPGAGWQPAGEVMVPEGPARLYVLEEPGPPDPHPAPGDEDAPSQQQTSGAFILPRPEARRRVVLGEPTVGTLLEWGRVHAPELAVPADPAGLARGTSGLRDTTPEQVKHFAELALERERAALAGFRQRMLMEPVGFLHLEQLSFTPIGIERGELLHSIPLAPDEEISVSHKEWSNTSEEFQRLATDFFEGFSEEGVAEKAELAQSTNVQAQHSSGLNTAVTASGSYGTVNVTASASFNLAQSASQSAQLSRNQSVTATRHASARSRQEHKVSFKIGREAGSSEEAVRKLRNPYSNRVTRVDYYQLVRKWKVDLLRYGIRLTYDLTIPEPGLDIISRILEMQGLQAALQEGFGDSDATQPAARFDLQPTALTRQNYAAEAAKYKATVPAPPPELLSVAKSTEHKWSSFEESQRGGAFGLEIELNPSYFVQSAVLGLTSWEWPAHAKERDRDTGLLTSSADLVGRFERVLVRYQARYASVLLVSVQLQLKLKDEAFSAWQLAAWNAIREAAQERYYEQRQFLRDRLEQLTKEIGEQDPLSLRKLEREEVMKGVLRWLLGPNFTFLPPDIPSELYEDDGSIIDGATWARLSAFGEVIKFLHQAIEWENMLYFLYPYFWSNVARWEAKKYLDHPDLLHRAFLKAGSARVVLTIRPGFESAFVSLLDVGAITGSHPYLTIAQEMERFAKTNYPGLQSANPVIGARPLLTTKQQAAWADIQTLEQLLEAYLADQGSYPTTSQGLAALSSYTSPTIPSVPTKDPWGNAYAYQSPGDHGDYELLSYGSDGAAGGEGDAADITSWAEASLIGTWYDYTPTSAMDIAFDATLPEA